MVAVQIPVAPTHDGKVSENDAVNPCPAPLSSGRLQTDEMGATLVPLFPNVKQAPVAGGSSSWYLNAK